MDAFSAFLLQQAVSKRDATTFCLVLDEVVANIFSYAFTDKATHRVEIQLQVHSDTIILVVTDDGLPFDPTKNMAPDITLPLDKRPIGGLGIHLIKSFTQDVAYQYINKRNVLTLTKKYK